MKNSVKELNNQALLLKLSAFTLHLFRELIEVYKKLTAFFEKTVIIIQACIFNNMTPQLMLRQVFCPYGLQ